MAKTITKTEVGNKGKTGFVKTKVKDTSKLSGRQQVKMKKLETKAGMSKNAMATAIAGELTGAITGSVAAHEQGQTERARYQNNAMNEALNKWNGLLKSTPNEADGTNPGMEGTSNAQGDNNSTGSNPNLVGW